MKEVVFEADSAHPRDVVDAGLQVLIRVDLDAFVALKDKYLEFGLKRAIRDPSHMFWQHEGRDMWEEIKALVNARINEKFVFGQSAEAPEMVGIFERQ